MSTTNSEGTGTPESTTEIERVAEQPTPEELPPPIERSSKRRGRRSSARLRGRGGFEFMVRPLSAADLPYIEHSLKLAENEAASRFGLLRDLFIPAVVGVLGRSLESPEFSIAACGFAAESIPPTLSPIGFYLTVLHPAKDSVRRHSFVGSFVAPHARKKGVFKALRTATLLKLRRLGVVDLIHSLSVNDQLGMVALEKIGGAVAYQTVVRQDIGVWYSAYTDRKIERARRKAAEQEGKSGE